MKNGRMDAEEFDQVLESDQCPECGHIWTDYKQGHYHDCRYFTLSDESDEEFRFEEEVRPWQLSLFKPAV